METTPTTAALGANRYGKSGIRVAKVSRDGDVHTFCDLTLDVWLRGNFAAAHVAGDNRAVLPTDTMRGTVYAFAAEHPTRPVEAFGLLLADHFLAAAPTADLAQVDVWEQGWDRLRLDGEPHGSAFTRGAGGVRTAAVTVEGGGAATVVAGMRDWYVLKTTRSAFSGFLVDEYTTLPETDDRILATAITARWRYPSTDVDFDGCFARVRRVMAHVFAEHDSRSVQHTEYAMGEAVLAACPEVAEISFTLPNQHHIGVDLSPYGLSNDNSVFVVTDRPYGVIEATVRRDASSAG